MTVRRLDHVNIRTARLAESIDFYANVLGMVVAPPPMAADASRGAYALDRDGTAVVHLVAAPASPDTPPPVRGQARRGMVDHFALYCEDRDAFIERLTARGLDFSAEDVPEIGARLIFVRDPNEVLVELNFPFT